ncbi:Stp1/IreP family PP2C-type Ser/Thr phosphatase [Proteiniclasticum ruminis]|uniref:Protein phosphatase n=1 Tax=Proteiniclasticum ruminis TaxID=398199 RepID=A0A1I4YG88_9CLOT|nr:Stp1/IreP family PP2C-type Ser/Thr phosphatase [Proteiniclasticum ruminis]SFN36992.1 protein phosphatase [Proteiniclasticum ruminis]
MIERISDIGNIRQLNEDTYGILEDEVFNLFLICDGMGGHNAGEVASALAKETVLDFMKGIKQEELLLPSLMKAITKANHEIYALSSKEKTMSGMGTTMTAALSHHGRLDVAHVGDSSLYVVYNNEIKKITKDHSYVQELVDLGKITEEDAKHHPNKNIITRAVGTNLHVEIEAYTRQTEHEETYLLCTDGLSDYLSAQEILEKLSGSQDMHKSMMELVDLAKERGGRDNITLVIFGGEALK